MLKHLVQEQIMNFFSGCAFGHNEIAEAHNFNVMISSEQPNKLQKFVTYLMSFLLDLSCVMRKLEFCQSENKGADPNFQVSILL